MQNDRADLLKPTNGMNPNNFNQWLLWKTNERDGKRTKVPIQSNGTLASVSNPATWCTCNEAREAAKDFGDGIGFVLTDDDPFVVIDLDSSHLPENAERHSSILNAFDGTYTEKSPSGNGYHIYCRGKWPTAGNRFGSVEVYQSKRFITVMLNGEPNPIIDCQPQLDHLWMQLKGKEPKNSCPMERNLESPETLTDAELLERAKLARNGDKFADLWNGDFANHYPRADGSGDQSRADFALINMIGFYSGNFVQTKRLFRQSALGKREKAKRDDYVDKMIHQALSERPSYDPSQFEGLTNTVNATRSNSELGRRKRNWPIMNDNAFYGIAGKLVRAIEPHSESDRIAVLAQFLAAIGCMFGHGAYFHVEQTKHYPNLYCVIVGDTSKARKGTSWGWVRRLMVLIDPDFVTDRIRGGIATGEGLIDLVHDPEVEEVPISGGLKTSKKRMKQVKLGISDKRLLVQESEFSTTLNVMKREGNTLVDMARKGWDGNEVLATNARHYKATATDAHIAWIGHTTIQELIHLLSTTDSFNGFGNRFLWPLVKRSQLLPTGGGIDPDALLTPFVGPVRHAIEFARDCGRVTFDEDAILLWESIYEAEAIAHPGLLGAMTARGEAQILRIALVYALLDCSATIRRDHLRAAKSVWDYCKESTSIIFGKSTGDVLADRIMDLILDGEGAGISRTELSNLLKRNQSKRKLDNAINLLAESNLVRIETIPLKNNKYETRYFAV